MTTIQLHGLLARSIKTRRLSAASPTLLQQYIDAWLDGTSPHPDAGEVGGKEKKVHGMVFGDAYNSTTTDIEVLIFYSE